MMLDLKNLGIDPETPIKNIANLNPVYSLETEKIEEVIEKMVFSGHRSIPVVSEEKKLVGIISVTDILDIYIRSVDLKKLVASEMIKEVISVDENDTVRFVLQKMKLSKKGRLPVTSDGILVGMVGESDYVRRVASEFFDSFKNKDVMTPKPFFVGPEMLVSECVRIMVNSKYRRLPVVKKGKLVGYITSTRLLKKIWEENFSKEIGNEKIEKIMTSNPFTLSPDERLSKTLEVMKNNEISSMLIVDEEKTLLGIITERDIIELIY